MMARIFAPIRVLAGARASGSSTGLWRVSLEAPDLLRQPDPGVPAAVIHRDRRRRKARIGEGADGNADRILHAFFGMKQRRSADRTESEDKARALIASTHIFRGGTGHRVGRGETRERREHASGPSLASQAVAEADAARFAFELDL